MSKSEEVNAKKERYERDAALALLDGVSQLHVARGKKIVQVNLKKDRPDDDTLAGLLLGPTGNLRAPTLRRGKTLIVGFNEDMYSDLLTG